MTHDLIPKYQQLLDELSHTEHGQKERLGMTAFLSREDIKEVDLQKLVDVYNQGVEAGNLQIDYVQHPVFRWVSYISVFERRGTIRSHLSPEQINAIVKANRARLLNRDTRYSPIR